MRVKINTDGPYASNLQHHFGYRATTHSEHGVFRLLSGVDCRQKVFLVRCSMMDCIKFMRPDVTKRKVG